MAYELGADPWTAYNQGQQAANQNLMAPIQRQSALEELQTQRQQNALGAIKANQAQMTYSDTLGARQAAAGAQGTPAQTVTTQAPPQTDPQAASSLQLMQNGASMNLTGNNPNSDISKLGANVAANPGFAALTGSDKRLASMQADQSAQQTAQQAPATQPLIQPDTNVQATQTQTTTTPAQPPNRMKAQIDYYNSVGNVDAANQLKTQVMQQAKSAVDLSGNVASGLKIINDATGENLTIAHMPDYEILKNGDQPVSLIDKGTMKALQLQGVSLSDAYKQSQIPLNLGGSGQQIMDYLSKNPMKTPSDIAGLYKYAAENNIPVKTVEPFATLAQKAITETDANERQQAGFEHSDALQIKTQSHSDVLQARGFEHSDAVQAKTIAAGRLYPALDSQNRNAPVMITSEQNGAFPGRYLPAGAGAKALSQTNLQEDIKGTIANTRKSLSNLDADFTPAQAAQLNVAMRSNNPHSAVSAFYQSGIGSTLTPKQQEYIADLQQLTENAMAMRSVLGAGQGSDDLRSAITATLPNATTPDRKTASMKLDKFEGTINRLSRGIPQVSLNPMPGQQQVNGWANVPEGATVKGSDGVYKKVNGQKVKVQ